MKKRWIVVSVAGVCFAGGSFANECVECHKKVTPNIVTDWQLSKHSQKDVTCDVCHGDEHKSTNDVAKVKIPTPETCAPCHEKRVEQFKAGKHAIAWAAMKAMPTAHMQPMAMMEGMKGCGGCHKIGMKTEAEIQELKKNGAVSAWLPAMPVTRGILFLFQEARATASLPDLSHGL